MLCTVLLSKSRVDTFIWIGSGQLCLPIVIALGKSDRGVAVLDIACHAIDAWVEEPPVQEVIAYSKLLIPRAWRVRIAKIKAHNVRVCAVESATEIEGQ